MAGCLSDCSGAGLESGRSGKEGRKVRGGTGRPLYIQPGVQGTPLRAPSARAGDSHKGTAAGGKCNRDQARPAENS
ncbi:hypothetical protein T03_17557 [Trichinella britovi]|uniref:Uncharacterized protein n=1 Tax=Trichinella britovi TaxID=45882 RepID=A0A0V1C8V9_TRIBR|nr:hypothetical protein T03_17557 [Trichinella britovi]